MSSQQLSDVLVTIDSSTDTVNLGENLDLTISVTNNGSGETPPIVVHLDITDLAGETSVDPEDWTPTLSKPIGPIDPGQTVEVTWKIQPISAGDPFSVYAVALAPGSETIVTSDVLSVTVIDQRTLNPGGILPVAIGAPLVVGGLLLAQILGVRRRFTPTLF